MQRARIVLFLLIAGASLVNLLELGKRGGLEPIGPPPTPKSTADSSLSRIWSVATPDRSGYYYELHKKSILAPRYDAAIAEVVIVAIGGTMLFLTKSKISEIA